MGTETSWQDVGARIGEARRAAGLTQGQLAERVGLDRTAISKIESGTRRIGALELTRLADALSLPVDHFLTAPALVLSNRQQVVEDDESEATRSAFRTEALLSAWLRDVRQLLDLGFLLPRDPWHYPHPVDGAESYREAARWVRSELRLQNGQNSPLDSMAPICAQLGQWPLVAEIPGDGASLIDGDVAVSIISLRGDPGRRRATAAHELGHLVLGDAYSNDLGVHASVEKREQAIEAFAAELLLPLAAINESWSSDSPERDQLIYFAAEYRVSWSLALAQAKRADVIDHASRNLLMARKPTRAEFMQAMGWVPVPDLSAVRVAPEYASAVVKAYKSRKLSRARAVEMLHGQVNSEDLPNEEDLDS
ncbi:helix-turn-helix domain-containing protein [Streptomyces sp. NPDC058001]|uniref:helix-turn-helix domain-containing protein n=1 Tax=Streptomyces sp. NPDC058001 TaxID=3346300 RepID=UPI0036E2B5F3